MDIVAVDVPAFHVQPKFTRYVALSDTMTVGSCMNVKAVLSPFFVPVAVKREIPELLLLSTRIRPVIWSI